MITVPYTIVADSGIQEGHSAAAGPSAQLLYRVSWEDRYTFINQALGSVSGDQTNGIVRQLPHTYPDRPNLYATGDVSVRGFGMMRVTSGVPSYDYADIAVNYAIPQVRFDFDPNGGELPGQNTPDPLRIPFTITRASGSVEFLTMPTATYKFNDTTPAQTPVVKRISHIRWEFRRLYMPFVPIATLDGLIGKVNDATWFGFPQETLLFEGYDVTRTAHIGGEITYELTYNFDYRSINWNFAPFPSTGEFVYVFADTADPLSTPYAIADFRTIP